MQFYESVQKQYSENDRYQLTKILQTAFQARAFNKQLNLNALLQSASFLKIFTFFFQIEKHHCSTETLLLKICEINDVIDRDVTEIRVGDEIVLHDIKIENVRITVEKNFANPGNVSHRYFDEFFATFIA